MGCLGWPQHLARTGPVHSFHHLCNCPYGDLVEVHSGTCFPKSPSPRADRAASQKQSAGSCTKAPQRCNSPLAPRQTLLFWAVKGRRCCWHILLLPKVGESSGHPCTPAASLTLGEFSTSLPFASHHQLPLNISLFPSTWAAGGSTAAPCAQRSTLVQPRGSQHSQGHWEGHGDVAWRMSPACHCPCAPKVPCPGCARPTGPSTEVAHTRHPRPSPPAASLIRSMEYFSTYGKATTDGGGSRC